MALTTLAGEKSDVKIQHASIASGNLSLINESSTKKKILGKKKSRTSEEKQENTVSEEKKQENLKSEKSNFSIYLLFFYNF